MYNHHALEIHIDGSAYNNPGNEGGIAGIVEYPDCLNREIEQIFLKRFSKTSNQRAELLAYIEALKWIRKYVQVSEVSRVIIFTDSQYVYENQFRAISWKKNRWASKEGRPIKNYDCWKEILALKPKIRIRIDTMYEKGKSTAISKQVDKLAKKAAKSGIKFIDYGYRPGRVARTKIAEGVAILFPAKNQESIIRVYRHRYMENVKKYEVSFELFSEKGGLFPGKYYAYVSKKEKRKIHLRNYYKVKFNKKPNFPTFYVLKKMGSSLKSGT